MLRARTGRRPTSRFVPSLFVASAVLAFAPALAAQNPLTIAVWDDAGNPLTSAHVAGTSGNGLVKAVNQGDGTYLIADGGLFDGSVVKATVDVSDDAWGFASHDVLLNPSGNLRLDIVFLGANASDVFSPDLIQGTDPVPGDGSASNDLCSNAIAMSVGQTVTGSTTNATLDGVDFCGTSNTAPGVWYTVVGNGNTLTATTCSTAVQYDTKISVFCGDCDDLTCIAGNDDNCSGGSSIFLSSASWCSQAGATYRILVHGFGSATGNFSLTVNNGTACTATIDCIPPVPTGACCFSDGSCEILSADDCGDAGGQYQGDDSPCFSAGDETVYPFTSGAAIPDNNPGGVTVSGTVTDSATIADLDLRLNITHTWVGDLVVELSHNGGPFVAVVDRPGVPASTFGCSSDNFSGARLDDEGASAIEGVCLTNLTSPPNYVPNNPLSAFDGHNIQGTWTLRVTDLAGGDTGSIGSWALINSEAGAGVCPAECALVIGDGQGSAQHEAFGHVFSTQVGPVIEDSYSVLMEMEQPEFVLPTVVGTRSNAGSVTVFGAGQTGSGSWSYLPNPGTPDWMLDGSFAVQLLMWNPEVFPGLPEQFSTGLNVQILNNGRLLTEPFGTQVGGVTVWAEKDVNAEGLPVVRFPFLIDLP